MEAVYIACSIEWVHSTSVQRLQGGPED